MNTKSGNPKHQERIAARKAKTLVNHAVGLLLFQQPNLDTKYVAKTFRIPVMAVAALKAHNTMGHSNPIDSATSHC